MSKNGHANGEMTAKEEARFAAQEREELRNSAEHIIECGDVLNWFRRRVAQGRRGRGKERQAALPDRHKQGFRQLHEYRDQGAISGGQIEHQENGAGVLSARGRRRRSPRCRRRRLLYYEDDFKHKILSMGEAAGTEEKEMQDYLLRELISDGVLRYPVVMKSPDGKSMTTTTVMKHGPVVFMVTTTKAALNQENETRLLSIDIDDSEEQTRRVLDKVAEMVGRNAAKASMDFEPWRDFQRWLALGPCAVDVPFAKELGRQIVSAKAPRLRRDFSQILLAIKAHALLNQHRRKTDDRGQIIAEIDEDYLPVAALMGGIMSEASGVGIEPATPADNRRGEARHGGSAGGIRRNRLPDRHAPKSGQERGMATAGRGDEQGLRRQPRNAEGTARKISGHRSGNRAGAATAIG